MLAAIANAAIMLDGADCWAARRQGLASASGAGFDMIAVAKAATVPFRIPAIGAIPLSLPRGGWMLPALRGLLPTCNADASGRRHSEHRAALCLRFSDIPRLGCRELRVGTRPTRLFRCRRHRHFVVDPANRVGRG